MNDEFVIVIGCYLLNWATLLLLLRYSKHKKRTAFIHLSIQFLYSVLFLYSYLNSGPGGGILALYLLWFIVQGIHWLSYSVHLAILLIRSSRKSN